MNEEIDVKRRSRFVNELAAIQSNSYISKNSGEMDHQIKQSSKRPSTKMTLEEAEAVIKLQKNSNHLKTSRFNASMETPILKRIASDCLEPY